MLAQALFREEALPCTEKERCIDREGKRTKGYPTLPPHSTNRSWSYFDPGKLCNHCRPYWHAEMAANDLRMVARNAELIAEEKKAKGG